MKQNIELMREQILSGPIVKTLILSPNHKPARSGSLQPHRYFLAGTMIGQAIGAGLHERAKEVAKKTMLINFTILSIGTVLFALFRVPIFRFFINDPAIIAESRKVVLYFSASLPFFGIFSAVNNTFNSAGHTKKSMILSMLRLWGIRLPLSYGLGF